MEGIAEYLAGLAGRAPSYVDWSLVLEPVKAAANLLADEDDEVWQGEAISLTKAVVDAPTALVATGGHFGELEYGINLGISTLSESVLIAAREQTAALVSQVTETNRKLIREAIAQTESMNAYQAGLKNFCYRDRSQDEDLGGVGRCVRMCGPMDGGTVDIDKLFSNGKDRPSVHPWCRCGVVYGY